MEGSNKFADSFLSASVLKIIIIIIIILIIIIRRRIKFFLQMASMSHNVVFNRALHKN